MLFADLSFILTRCVYVCICVRKWSTVRIPCKYQLRCSREITTVIHRNWISFVGKYTNAINTSQSAESKKVNMFYLDQQEWHFSNALLLSTDCIAAIGYVIEWTLGNQFRPLNFSSIIQFQKSFPLMSNNDLK